jgi:hypothetical protein
MKIKKIDTIKRLMWRRRPQKKKELNYKIQLNKIRHKIQCSAHKEISG